ncbi:MAG: hypothetical protein EYC70_11530 [Planctomycetota bacterium]|nr:MAG: hypothetical protein EYC70_11530 [Planctomycetota bacterium]
MLHLLALLTPPQDPPTTVPEEKPVLQSIGIEKLVLGGDIRLRWESHDPLPPVRNASSRSEGTGRFRVHLDATFDENLSGFVQFQETVLDQGGQSESFLHQGYGTLHNVLDTIEVQVGRFEMQYGNQRMISPLDWSQVGRAWDGARAVLATGDGRWQGDLFWTSPVENQVNNAPDSEFGGLYGQWNGAPLSVDGYVLRRNAMGLDDYTVGALVDGGPGTLTWNAEAAVQVGDHGPLDAFAYAVAGRLDWNFQGADGARVGLGYELASGDEDPSDGDSGTFFRLFNFDHAYQGYADIVVWQNIQDLVVRSWWPLGNGWGISGDVHWLNLASEDDALYTGVGGAGAVASGTDGNVGTEIDVTLRGSFLNRLEIWTGVAQFFAGDAIQNGADQTWIFVQATLPF